MRDAADRCKVLPLIDLLVHFILRFLCAVRLEQLSIKDFLKPIHRFTVDKVNDAQRCPFHDRAVRRVGLGVDEIQILFLLDFAQLLLHALHGQLILLQQPLVLVRDIAKLAHLVAILGCDLLFVVVQVAQAGPLEPQVHPLQHQRIWRWIALVRRAPHHAPQAVHEQGHMLVQPVHEHRQRGLVDLGKPDHTEQPAGGLP
uniref:Putative secreted protein n=1 Tax=Anopheles darlingi TaxID=43151 RepID=A0A2M4D712_ANODA